MLAPNENYIEEILEKRVLSGEVSALAELFAIYRPRLYRTVEFRLDPRLTSRVGVDDVLQESFLDASRRIRHFGENQNMSPFIWLRWIVSQTLVDIHRRHLGAQMRDAGRERSLFRRNPQATSVSFAAQLLGHLTSPSQAALRNEAHDQLGQVLEQLSKNDQEIIALRHFEELTNQEVAEALGIEQKAASIRYVRAIRRLKQLLDATPGYFTAPRH